MDNKEIFDPVGDLSTLLDRLQSSHDPNGPIVFAERVAAALACKNLEEVADIEFPDGVVVELVDQLEQAHKDLLARAELVEIAFERLQHWASKSVG